MKKLAICSIIILLIFVILNMSYTVYGAEIQVVDSVRVATTSELIDPDDYEPGGIDEALNEAGRVTEFASTIIAVIRTVGIIVTVITLMIMGIKYMTASIEERADYKKSMIPYLIGVFIFFALSQLIPIIIDIADNLNDL